MDLMQECGEPLRQLVLQAAAGAGADEAIALLKHLQGSETRQGEVEPEEA